MQVLEKKSFNQPNEVRTFEKGRVEVVTLGDKPVMRAIFEPGWKWSECVKPIAKTASCEVVHLGYMVSGKMAVQMTDGSEVVYEPGDVGYMPAGHDAWIVGDETAVFIDFQGAASYAK